MASLAIGCMIPTIKPHWGLVPLANTHAEHTTKKEDV